MFYNVSIIARMSSPLASCARFDALTFSLFARAPYSNEYNLPGAALSASYAAITLEEAPLRVEAPSIIYTTLMPSAASALPAAAAAAAGAADDTRSEFALSPAAQVQPPAPSPRYSRAALQPSQSSHSVGDTQPQQQQQQQAPSIATYDSGVRYAEGLLLRRASGIRGRILRYYAVVVTATQAAGTTPDAFLASKVRALHSQDELCLILYL